MSAAFVSAEWNIVQACTNEYVLHMYKAVPRVLVELLEGEGVILKQNYFNYIDWFYEHSLI